MKGGKGYGAGKMPPAHELRFADRRRESKVDFSSKGTDNEPAFKEAS
jgi:hypothetical protein